MNRIAQGAPDGNNVPRAKVRLETNWENPNDPRITDPNDKTRTKDNDLWKAMDDAARKLAASFAALGTVQYLSRPNDPDNAHWTDAPPPRALCQDTLSSTHHEAGTLWIGDSTASSVTDTTGRVWSLQNCYVAGPALLPTIGSPNPMLSGVALARRTAGFKWLFDGRIGSFNRWRRVGPGGFALRDGLIVAQPRGDHSVLYFGPERFDNFILRLQFRLPGPIDQFGKAVGNSGVFVRFRQPHARWEDVNQIKPEAAGNPAWVAPLTGFEVQLDEQGKDFYFNKHRTGAIYDVSAGDVVNGVMEPKEQNFTPFDVLQPGAWYEFEIEVQKDSYTVRMGRFVQGRATAFQPVTSFTKPAGKYPKRGLSASTDPHSGYIGIQAHSGGVAFRAIRIRAL
jgi:Domain of Unknown Function (DUF1080)/GMC oxidoreductase